MTPSCGGASGRAWANVRRALVSLARGSVLELGAGTGLNLDLYPDGLDRLVMAEPEPNMVKRLEQRRERLGRRAEIVRAAAEALPFADDTFDTVVSTMVLCTVPDPTRALDEVRRVLRPDGSLLFVEHVRSDDPGLPVGRTAFTARGTALPTAATAIVRPPTFCAAPATWSHSLSAQTGAGCHRSFGP